MLFDVVVLLRKNVLVCVMSFFDSLIVLLNVSVSIMCFVLNLSWCRFGISIGYVLINVFMFVDMVVFVIICDIVWCRLLCDNGCGLIVMMCSCL